MSRSAELTYFNKLPITDPGAFNINYWIKEIKNEKSREHLLRNNSPPAANLINYNEGLNSEDTR
ncbi:hypothetical protein PUN28_018614 [Cardiocondyla obscurior]|uniref:Uncharacterized protein n=1 Tax=Cardiocondyla obscurior TaxID=286306 RepID=A0AAW2EEQ2_9HYME